MDSLDFLDQKSDELSLQLLDHSPPRLEDEHAEPNVVENNQVEINATIAKSNRVPIDESVDDFFDFSPLKFVQGENTQVENPPSVDGINPLSVDESFEFSPLNLEGENTQVENPPSADGILNPLSFDECFDFSPLNLEGENTQEHPSVDGILNLLSIDESLDFDFDFSQPPPPVQAGERAVEWTFDENKEFENALAEFDHSSPNFLEELASRVPSKSISEIKTHYEKLVYDIELIEAGKVELPDYLDNQQPELEAADGGDDEVAKEPQGKGKGKGIAAAEKKKRRGSTAWTEEEHTNFLKGLAEFGKGDWRSISRVHVLTKNPTQIASHAQKFFRRQRNSTKSSAAAGAATSSTYPYPRRRRRSIHDIDKVVTPTTTITISTSPPKPDTTPQQAEQSLHTPKPSVDPDLTNTINAQQSCTSSPPLISSSTTVSIPLLQSINEEAPFPPLANPHMIPPLQSFDEQAPNFPPPPSPYNMTLPSWITTTTTLIPPRRPRGRPRHNFNPRVHLPPASIPLTLMHLNLPSRINSSTIPAIALIPPWPPRHNFNIPRPTTQQPAISPLMGRLNLTNFRPPILIPSTPRPTVSIPSIRGHHLNPPQTGHQQQYQLPPNFPDHLNPPQIYHHQQQYEIPPVPECFDVADFPPIPLIRHNSNNIPDPETDHHDAELPPLPYCNVPFPPPLTSGTPAMNPPPFEQTQSFLSFYHRSVPCSTTVSTTTSDIPGPSAGGHSSSSSSHPPAKIWFGPN